MLSRSDTLVLIMNSFAIYPDDRLVHLRLLQRYMSAGIMSLVISRGGFVVSLLLLATGTAFIVVGRFFFWERHQLYGCRPDYATSITSRVCSSDWRRHAGGSLDSSTLTCLASGTVALLVALAYPYALLAIKGSREEIEEIRSIVHPAHRSAAMADDHSRDNWERTVLRLTGLHSTHRPWIYFRHPNLDRRLDRRRRFRRFAACLWTEVFARVALREYCFPVAIAVLVLASAAVDPSLMRHSSAIVRIVSVFVSLLAYVAILVVSLAAFAVIVIIEPTAWMGCLAFWLVHLLIHLLCYAVHSCASRVPMVLDKRRLHGEVPSAVVQQVFDRVF